MWLASKILPLCGLVGALGFCIWSNVQMRRYSAKSNQSYDEKMYRVMLALNGAGALVLTGSLLVLITGKLPLIALVSCAAAVAYIYLIHVKQRIGE